MQLFHHFGTEGIYAVQCNSPSAGRKQLICAKRFRSLLPALRLALRFKPVRNAAIGEEAHDTEHCERGGNDEHYVPAAAEPLYFLNLSITAPDQRYTDSSSPSKDFHAFHSSYCHLSNPIRLLKPGYIRSRHYRMSCHPTVNPDAVFPAVLRCLAYRSAKNPCTIIRNRHLYLLRIYGLSALGAVGHSHLIAVLDGAGAGGDDIVPIAGGLRRRRSYCHRRQHLDADALCDIAVAEGRALLADGKGQTSRYCRCGWRNWARWCRNSRSSGRRRG